jgi:hypothetical protein
MFCMNCGAKIEDGENFCSGCGAPREVAAGAPEASDPAVAVVFCMNCGTRMEASDRFCEECGFDQSATAPYAARDGGGAKKVKRAAKIVLSLAAVALILFACGATASKYISWADVAAGVLPWGENPEPEPKDSERPALSAAPPSEIISPTGEDAASGKMTAGASQTAPQAVAAAPDNFPAPPATSAAQAAPLPPIINPPAQAPTRPENPPAAAKPTEAPIMSEGYITGSNVYFRRTPNGERKSAKLQINDRVKVIALQFSNGDPWYRVVFNGEDGWISGRYVNDKPKNETSAAAAAQKPSPANSAAKAKALVEQGKSHWKKSDWQAAYGAFSEAYKLTPTGEIKQYMENASANVENTSYSRLSPDAFIGSITGTWRAMSGQRKWSKGGPESPIKEGYMTITGGPGSGGISFRGNLFFMDGSFSYSDSTYNAWHSGKSKIGWRGWRVSNNIATTFSSKSVPYEATLDLIATDTLLFHSSDQESDFTVTFKRVSR